VSPPQAEGTAAHQGGGRLQSRDKKRLVAVVVLALALAWLIAFIVSNTEHVKVSFVFGDVSVSLVWVMLICAVLGALVALALLRVLRRRRQR
jgi:uncharacterized integral membrane protein